MDQMYIVNLSKKPFTDSLSYLRNCGFYILIFESFFSGHRDPALPGYRPLHRHLYPVWRWEGGLHLRTTYLTTWHSAGDRDLRECTRYSPRRSVITKSYSFEGFVRIHFLVDPVLQRGHPGREYARERGAEWAGLPFAPLQAWAGRVCRVPSPHQEGVYFTTVRPSVRFKLV